VVVVAFRSADVLERCLASIPPEVEVIVVNQDSPDDSTSVALAAGRDVRLLEAGGNRGFGAGCNIGAANATGDIVVFLNPDARLHPGALEKLVAASAAAGGTLVGPRIVEEGEDVTRARRFSSVFTDGLDLMVPRALIPRRWHRDIPPSDPVYTDGGEVPYVQGACMAVGRELFAQAGRFDERYFLYGEEETLALRLRERGLAARLEPAAVISHEGHTSTQKTGGFAVEQYFSTRIKFYKKESGSAAAFASFCTLMACNAVLWALTPVRQATGYRDDYSAGWCVAAMRGLVQGLLDRPVRPPR
jgi:GT2 family glycosyltransferase